MKNGFSKILLIVIVAIIVIIGVTVVLMNKKTTPNNPTSPSELAQFKQLPTENDHFKITYDASQNSLTIVPKIPFDSSEAPATFFQQYWTGYQNYAYEALDWLSAHQMDQTFRTNFGVKIIWWGQEWWPAGAKI